MATIFDCILSKTLNFRIVFIPNSYAKTSPGIMHLYFFLHPSRSNFLRSIKILWKMNMAVGDVFFYASRPHRASQEREICRYKDNLFVASGGGLQEQRVKTILEARFEGKGAPERQDLKGWSVIGAVNHYGACETPGDVSVFTKSTRVFRYYW